MFSKKYNNSTGLANLVGLCIDSQNGDDFGRNEKVFEYTYIFLECYNDKNLLKKIPTSEMEMVSEAAAIRDIGKIMVSKEVLTKPDSLSYEEMEAVKQHVNYGCLIIDNANLDEPFYSICKDVIQYHHERYDGSGYPLGIKGEDIPFYAQIVGIIDVYNALVTNKIYKKAYPKEVAVELILSGKCGAFSKEILSIFKCAVTEFD